MSATVKTIYNTVFELYISYVTSQGDVRSLKCLNLHKLLSLSLKIIQVEVTRIIRHTIVCH